MIEWVNLILCIGDLKQFGLILSWAGLTIVRPSYRRNIIFPKRRFLSHFRHFSPFKLMELDEMVTVDHQQEEFVLLDLDAVCCHIPTDGPYTLSGLNTLNPILTIGDNLKLIGEYEETIGTCLIFSENESRPTVHEDRGSSSGANLPKELVKPVTSLQKILKFRLLTEADVQVSANNPPDVPQPTEGVATDN